MKWLLFLALLVPRVASAYEEGFIGFGPGLGIDNKYLELGHREDLWYNVYWQYKFIASHTAITVLGDVGLQIDFKPIELRSGLGMGATSNPDSGNGVFPQLNSETYIGVRDINGNGIGLQYEYLGNFGQGQNFIILQISQRF